MFSKKEIDNFILREASKYLFEEEETVDDKIKRIEDSLKTAKQNLENSKKALTTEKNKASSIQGSGPTIALQKKQAMLGAEIKEKEIKQIEASVEAFENELNSAKSEKINAEKTSKQIAAGETVSEAVQVAPIKKAAPVKPKPKKKELIVRFDTNTPTPFTVKFTSRGFVVGNTRLSFELLDKAISKQFSVTLKNGLVLTPVKMQKILKYKNRY
jgi:archaellum component FlaC